MRAVPALLLFLVPALVFADTDPRFVNLRETAEKYDGTLASFAEHYVGDCSDATDQECRHAAETFRQHVNGKKFFFIIGEEQVNNLAMGPYDLANGIFAMNLIPFFPAGDYGISQGGPHRTDGRGNPVFPYVRLKGPMPEGWNPPKIARLIHMREVRLQIVFTPESVWSLPRRGGGKILGVKAKLNGIVAEDVTTGATIATYFAR